MLDFAVVLAVNMDTVAVVEPMHPEPDAARIERLLSLAWDSGARPVVLLTKADTAVDPAACVANARRFDASVFRAAFPREVEQALARQSQEPAPHRGSRRARFAWSPVARR